MSIHKKILSTVSGIALASTGALADDKPYGPEVNLSGKFSSARSLGEVEMLVPLFQTQNTLLFMDARGMTDSLGNEEGNIGMGIRHIFNDKFIIGGYGFFDSRRSENDRTHKQYTFGAELMTEKFDLRFNYYEANNDFREISRSAITVLTSDPVPGGGTPYVAGNGIWTGGFEEYTTTTRIVGERALDGWDVEAGYELFSGFRAFGGYYKFSHGSEKLDGSKFRGEWNVLDSQKSNKRVDITLTGDYTNDEVRGSIFSGGVKLRIPFGKKESRKSKSKLQKRMTEYVRRDVDVVTKFNDTTTVVVTQEDTTVLLSDPDTNYWFVDNTATGLDNGSFENPFNTLAEAEEASGVGDFIFVYAGDGTSTGYDNGIALKDSQTLFGEGVGLAWDDTPLIAAGDMPLITHTLANGVIINLSNDNTVSGVHVDGRDVVSHGIYGLGISGTFDISDNRIENIAIGDGYVSDAMTNVVTDIGGNGILLYNQFDGDITLVASNNTSMNNADRGLWVGTITGLNSLTATNNTFNDNARSGLLASSEGSLIANFTNNTASNNGNNGIFAINGTGSVNVTATGNTTQNNLNFGIIAEGTMDATFTAVNNVVSDNVSSGIAGYAYNGDLVMTATGNSLTDNASGMFGWSIFGDATLTATNNTVTGNSQNGIMVFAGASDALLTGTLTGNALTGNGVGASFYSGGVALVTATNNNASDNEYAGFEVYSDTLTATLNATGNTTSNNGQFGMVLVSDLGVSTTINATSNTVNDNGWAGLITYTYLGDSVINATDNTITGNYIQGVAVLNGDFFGQIDMDADDYIPSTGSATFVGTGNTISANGTNEDINDFFDLDGINDEDIRDGFRVGGIVLFSEYGDATVSITNNSIQTNIGDGLSVWSEAGDTTLVGSGNSITDNTLNGIIITSVAGSIDLGSETGSVGNNRIFSNHTEGVMGTFDINSLNTVGDKGLNNWWGCPQGADWSWLNGTMDRSSHLTADPNSGAGGAAIAFCGAI